MHVILLYFLAWRIIIYGANLNNIVFRKSMHLPLEVHVWCITFDYLIQIVMLLRYQLCKDFMLFIAALLF